MQIKATHKIPNAYRGSNNMILTSGNGTPPADPSLTVIYTEGFAPEGLGFVSGYGIAVGVNSKGYLQPCDGTVIPYGIAAVPLMTSAAFADANGTSLVPTLTNGALNQVDDLHQMTPTIFTNNALFQTGLSYNIAATVINGVTYTLDTTKMTLASVKALLEFKIGDNLRPATAEEVSFLVDAKALLPVYVPSVNGQAQVLLTDAAKLKAYYAGMMVKLNTTSAVAGNVLTATPNDFTKVDHNMKCAKVAALLNPAQFDNYIYNGQYAFDYDVQGSNTKGLNREVWNILGPKLSNTETNTVNKILQYYVTL